jgi:protein TonB
MKAFLITTLLFLSFISVKAQTIPPPPPPPPDVDQVEKVDSSRYKLREAEPEFPGGLDKFIAYIKANFKMPKNAGDIKGRMIINFIIEKDGSVTNVKVMRGLSSDIDKEAQRVISESPKWEPDLQFGKPVRVAYSVPITLPLNSEK